MTKKKTIGGMEFWSKRVIKKGKLTEKKLLKAAADIFNANMAASGLMDTIAIGPKYPLLALLELLKMSTHRRFKIIDEDGEFIVTFKPKAK